MVVMVVGEERRGKGTGRDTCRPCSLPLPHSSPYVLPPLSSQYLADPRSARTQHQTHTRSPRSTSSSRRRRSSARPRRCGTRRTSSAWPWRWGTTLRAQAGAMPRPSRPKRRWSACAPRSRARLGGWWAGRMWVGRWRTDRGLVLRLVLRPGLGRGLERRYLPASLRARRRHPPQRPTRGWIWTATRMRMSSRRSNCRVCLSHLICRPIPDRQASAHNFGRPSRCLRSPIHRRDLLSPLVASHTPSV